ncbi:MAG: RidA family protein [Candidatus Micrarchaeota archaeon]
MERKKILYNVPLEKELGYSRAVRVGNIIAVTGTAATKDGKTVCPGDVYGQAKRSLEIIKDVVEKAGGRMEDVIRTRVFLKDITTYKEAFKAHGEVFSEIQPACTFAGVTGFPNPEWLIEIEADVIVRD